MAFGDFGEGLFDLGGGEVVEHDGEGVWVGGGFEGLGFVFDFDFDEGRFGFCGFFEGFCDRCVGEVVFFDEDGVAEVEAMGQSPTDGDGFFVEVVPLGFACGGEFGGSGKFGEFVCLGGDGGKAHEEV